MVHRRIEWLGCSDLVDGRCGLWIDGEVRVFVGDRDGRSSDNLQWRFPISIWVEDDAMADRRDSSGFVDDVRQSSVGGWSGRGIGCGAEMISVDVGS